MNLCAFLFPSDNLVSLNEMFSCSDVLFPLAPCQGSIWIFMALVATEEQGPPSPSAGRWDVGSLACFLSLGSWTTEGLVVILDLMV